MPLDRRPHTRAIVGRLLVWVAAAALACVLVPAAASAAFDLTGYWGGEGLGEGMFSGRIGGLATAANGDVYVVDQSANRIEEFNAGGGFITEWGEEGAGAGQMFEPASIAVAGGGSETGKLYVTDARNRRVDEFGPEGHFIRAWGWGVDQGNHAFEICTTSCLAGQPHGEDGGGFESPIGIAVDPMSGDVYVSDPMSNDAALPIQRFQSDGSFIETVGVSELLHGTAAGAFNEPTALATDSIGDLYVVDAGNERIQELGPTGTFMRLWGLGVLKGESGPSEQFRVCTNASECQIGGQGAKAGGFDFIEGAPASIAIDSAGNVWVPDGGNVRVQEFTSSGEIVMGFGWGVLDEGERFETCTATTGCKKGLKGAEPPWFEDLVGAAAAPSGCPVYVTDAGGNDLVDEFGVCGESGEVVTVPVEEHPTNSTPNEEPASTGGPPPAGNSSTGGPPASGGVKSNVASAAPSAASQEAALASAFGLPTAKLCYSRRAFKIHIHQPHGYPQIVSAVVFLGHHRERALSGKRLTAQVVLSGLPAGTFVIRIVARTANGTLLTGTRTYHTCRTKPLKGHHHKL